MDKPIRRFAIIQTCTYLFQVTNLHKGVKSISILFTPCILAY